MDLNVFEEASDALRGIMPGQFGRLRQQVRRYGMKVWFDAAQPPRVHYEAQVIGASAVEGAEVLAIEVGFHAEHPKAPDNDTVIAALVAAERRWRRTLGAEPVVGPFLGRNGTWRRVSETWPDPDLGDPDLAFEIAARLADYATALEPVLRGTGGRRGRQKAAGTIDTLAAPD